MNKPMFSIDYHDKDGDVVEEGIYLHYGDTAIRVAKTLDEFKAHNEILKSFEWEVAELL